MLKSIYARSDLEKEEHEKGEAYHASNALVAN